MPSGDKSHFLFVWKCLYLNFMGFPGGISGKVPAHQCRRCKRCGFDPWVRKIPWRRAWWPTPVFLPGGYHGQRSLAGCTPEGCKELDTTDVTWHACTRVGHTCCGAMTNGRVCQQKRYCRIARRYWGLDVWIKTFLIHVCLFIGLITLLLYYKILTLK